MLEGLRPGEHLVDVGGALDAAIGLASQTAPEEWRPGDKTKENEDTKNI
jgi:hypothetical protein